MSSGSVELRQGVGEDPDICDGQVHTLRSCGRDDVRGVSGEKEPSVLHRFADEGAHLHDVLLEDFASGQLPAVVGGEPRGELVPDPLIGPLLDVVLRVALEVEALDLGGAGADEGEAAVMEGVDQLLRRWRSPDEDAEPTKGIGSGVLRARVLRYPGPADPERAVAAGDVVAGDLLLLAILEEANLRRISVRVFYAFCPGLEQDLSVRFEPGADQVLDDFLLAVDGDREPVRQVGEVNAVPTSVEAKFDPVVNGSLPEHAPTPPSRFRRGYVRQLRRRSWLRALHSRRRSGGMPLQSLFPSGRR